MGPYAGVSLVTKLLRYLLAWYHKKALLVSCSSRSAKVPFFQKAQIVDRTHTKIARNEGGVVCRRQIPPPVQLLGEENNNCEGIHKPKTLNLLWRRCKTCWSAGACPVFMAITEHKIKLRWTVPIHDNFHFCKTCNSRGKPLVQWDTVPNVSSLPIVQWNEYHRTGKFSRTWNFHYICGWTHTRQKHYLHNNQCYTHVCHVHQLSGTSAKFNLWIISIIRTLQWYILKNFWMRKFPLLHSLQPSQSPKVSHCFSS